MPIVANPAAPFAPKINERFAAAEQYNKIFPQLAGLYEAAGRNYTQASAQTAQNQTSASAVSAGLEARRIAQERDAEFDAQRQQQQIAAQMAMQERAAQMEMERMNFRITKQEEMENTTRMNGLVEIEKQLKDNLLTPEQAADARTELITGINAFQRRQQYQQSQAMKQQENIRSQQFANMQKDEVSADEFEAKMIKAGIGVLKFRDNDGQPQFLIKNRNTGEWYNPKMSSSGKAAQEATVSPYADEAGGFSYKKALPEAKAEAEAAYPVIKGEDGKDKNERARAEYVQEMIRKREDEHRAGMNRQNQAPVTAPQQVGGPIGQNDRMGQSGQNDQLTQALNRLTQLKMQFPPGTPRPPQVQQEIDSLMALRNTTSK